MTTDSRTAKRMVEELLGDAELRAPGEKPGTLGKPYFHYFCQLDPLEASAEFHQIRQLKPWDRERDLLERMGLDGRAS